MPPLRMVLEVAELRAPVVAEGAGVRLLPSVGSRVSPEVFQLAKVLGADDAAVLEEAER